jgi:phosphoribosylformimino-5-aminoimidazole carboxamide ribotide isomerase
MRIIPVLDIMDGQVVHGVGGVRSRYRRIVSKVTKSSDPLHVAGDLKESFGFREVYIADLDAIQGNGSNLEQVEGIMGLGYSVYLDAGLGGAGDITPRLARIDHVVIGTETLQSLRELGVACRLHGSVVVSLDFKGDELLARDRSLKGMGARELAEVISGTGISGIIYLDLVRVGMGSGVSSKRMETVINASKLPVIVGGGVRNASDIETLAKLGADGALVATSLHTGELAPREIERFDTRGAPVPDPPEDTPRL